MPTCYRLNLIAFVVAAATHCTVPAEPAPAQDTVAIGDSAADAPRSSNDNATYSGAGQDSGTGASDSGEAEVGIASDAKPDVGTVLPGSCSIACGAAGQPGSCSCDKMCQSKGTCCADFAAFCGCTTSAQCTAATGVNNCADFVCYAGKCKAMAKKCDDDNECTTDLCDSSTGNCVHPAAVNGSKCTGVGQCQVGACSNGVCGPGTSKKDGTACKDAQNCTINDECLAGVCTGGPLLDCNDDNLCTNDTCAYEGGCYHSPLINPWYCDDGEPCTKADKCLNGACQGNMLPDGTACADNDACTVNDVCASGTCLGTAAANGAPCDDGDSCSSLDQCFKGACGSGNAVANGTACNDGFACTTADTCVFGACTGKLAAKGTACSDDNACTLNDSCGALGVCSGTSKLCNDNDACTQDQCDKTGVCQSKPNALCDDSNSCTADACFPGPKGSECSHKATAEGSECEDGNLCTSSAACKAGKCTSAFSKCALVTLDTFECGASGGWLLQPASGPKILSNGWGIDGGPDSTPPISPGCTLNFNGVDGTYSASTAGAKVGTATSGAFAVPDGAKLVIKLWSYFGVTVASGALQCTIEVSTDNFATKAVTYAVSSSKMPYAWEHLTLVTGDVGGKSVKVRFVFDGTDAKASNGKGWFVDNFSLETM